MQPADFVTEAQQQVVGEREQRTFERGEERQLVFRPLDGGQRGAQRFHFLAIVERFRPNQQVRDVATSKDRT